MLFRLKTMVYLVDFSIGLETFGMKNFPPKNRVRGGIRVIGGRVIGGEYCTYLDTQNAGLQIYRPARAV